MSQQARSRVLQLFGAVSSGAGCRCPAHSTVGARPASATPATTDYAVEMACSNIRYGPGVTREVGMDFTNMKIRNVCLVTDKNLRDLEPVKRAVGALESMKVKYDIFDDVRIEPTDSSFQKAIEFAFKGNYDGFLAVGGGSVIDTAKVANLMLCHPEADMFDFVNAPIGRGLPVRGQLKPLLAIPTTAGTGSETTGVAVFDCERVNAKTGIASRALRPTLGLVDPEHTLHMPERVAANSAYDVLCHAIESYTAVPYTERSPRPANPIERPAYQGSNPISDVWAAHALKIFAAYGKRSIFDAGDVEARSQMHLASTMAGIGFGNAGVHLCHGMSYPISGHVKPACRARGYDAVPHPLIPHGLSVVVTAPAVFHFTAPACPDRHLRAAEWLGADVTGVRQADAGRVLADVLRRIMSDTGVVDGLAALGYTTADIPQLVEGTLPQQRVTKLSPRSHTSDDLAKLFEDSMTIY